MSQLTGQSESTVGGERPRLTDEQWQLLFTLQWGRTPVDAEVRQKCLEAIDLLQQRLMGLPQSSVSAKVPSMQVEAPPS